MNDIYLAPGVADGGAKLLQYKQPAADLQVSRPLAPVYPRQSPESPGEGSRER